MDNFTVTEIERILRVTCNAYGSKYRKKVYERDGGKCDWCGEITNTWTVDHIVSRCHGGSDDIDNLRTLCLDCHGFRNTLENFQCRFDRPLISWNDIKLHLIFYWPAKQGGYYRRLVA